MAKRKPNHRWGILNCVIGLGRLIVALVALFNDAP